MGTALALVSLILSLLFFPLGLLITFFLSTYIKDVGSIRLND